MTGYIFAPRMLPMTTEDAIRLRERLHRALRARAEGLIRNSGRRRTSALVGEAYSDVFMTGDGVKFEEINDSLSKKGFGFLKLTEGGSK